MFDYEVTYILRPSFEEDQAEERSSAIAETVRTLGGEVVGIDRLGKRRLAYEIADVKDGYYVTMRFRATADQSKELERQMRLNDDILRSLLIRLEEHELVAFAQQPVAEPAEA